MLHPCIKLLLAEINAHIKARSGVGEEKVMLADLGVEATKSASEKGSAVLMSVVDIVKEEWSSNNKEYIPQSGGGYVTKSQPINFNLHLLFSSHTKPGHTLEGLKYLSLVIAFFQSKSYFDTLNTPSLQQLNLHNLSVELLDLEYEEKNALWSRIGIPYVPSVLYKLGTIPVEDQEAIGTDVPEIKDIIIQ